MRAYEILKQKKDYDKKKKLEKQKEEYVLKRSKVLSRLAEMDRIQTEFSDSTLKNLKYKFNTTRQRREGYITECIADKAKIENLKSNDHNARYKLDTDLQNEKNFMASIETQLKTKKKLKECEKADKRRQEIAKHDNLVREQKMLENREKEELQREQKVAKLANKMKKNEENVLRHKKRLSEEISLKQQKRLWKEKDIEITKRRHKRIQRQKQNNLIIKEKKHEGKIKEKKDKEKLKNEAKLRQTIKELGERDHLIKTLTQVLGSNEDVEYRNRVLEDNLLELKIAEEPESLDTQNMRKEER